MDIGQMMKRQIRKWLLRLTATGLLCIGLLVGIVLNPTLLYANKTETGNYTIYHHAPLDESFILQLNKATKLIRTSEVYDVNFNLDICLNDGSLYPSLMEMLSGPAFAWGFYNKVVLMGQVSSKDNFIELNGYKWNLIQLLAHEETHCFQFHKFGFWKSNPMANYPNWKWEGYPEYVARKNGNPFGLTENLARKIATETLGKGGWAIELNDSTISPKDYYTNWLLVQYCLDIKKMTYANLLKDTTSDQSTTNQMMNWFAKQK